MITAIIPTLNEQDNIEDAIASVSFADEIFVIDSFSTDKTVALAKQLGTKVVQRKFDNFSNQKNFALDLAAHDWIYILDADERLSPELKEEILEAVKDPKGCVGFYIYRTFYFQTTMIKYGGWQTDKVMRLFRRDSCRYDGKLVHEKIVHQGKAGFLKNRIDHFSFRDYEQYDGKLEFYAKLQAHELWENHKEIPMVHRWVKPGFRFMVLYLIRFGFLDGQQGYNLARLHAKAVSRRYECYDELKNKSD